MRLTFLTLIFTILILAPLRFTNLGYSEYQDDEKKAFYRPEGRTFVEFFMTQRKGPGQFVVSYLPYLFTKDFSNELAQRVPFTVLNLSSAFVLFLIIFNITKSKLASIFSTIFFGVNGFIIGFSRIAQYQNLNLFFGLSSLLCFVLFSQTPAKKCYSFLGTIFFSFSLLSHWDAIYYVVPVIFFYFNGLRNLPSRQRLIVSVQNVILGGFLILPFLIPYMYFQLSSVDNTSYFYRRMGFGGASINEHAFIFYLYNPFLTFQVYLVLFVLSLLNFKKNWIFYLWFLLNFIVLKFTMVKPGTHIYNYVIPLSMIAGLGVWSFQRLIPYRLLSIVFLLGVSICASFLWYQSYMLFVDHKQEYPWDQKKVWRFTTAPFESKSIITFGFPHKRGWKEIGKIIDNDPDNCRFITNEGIEKISLYVITDPGKGPCFYVVAVKKPFARGRDNANFAEVGGRKTVYKYEKDGVTLTKVYKIVKRID